VQVGEEQVVGPQHRDLLRLRLLDAEQHLGLVEHRLGVRHDPGALGRVLPVRNRAADPGAGLDEHLVAVLDELAHACRRERHAVLVGLDLRRYSHLHALSILPLGH
jgi:hypothetical protein